MRTSTMKLAVLAVACLFALNAHLAFASDVLPSDEALLYNDVDGQVASAQQQRALLQAATSYPPGYCANSHIKPVFTAKMAVLMVGTKKYGAITSADYVELITPRLNKRFRRYNLTYNLNLGFTISQLSSGGVTYGVQRWFYFDIQFVVGGTCGFYKFPLITQLRGEIQPSAPFIKRNRLMKYPFRD